MEENALYAITRAADGKGFFVTSEKPGSFGLLHVRVVVATSNPCFLTRYACYGAHFVAEIPLSKWSATR